MGGFEASAPAGVEPSMEYHPCLSEVLTRFLNQDRGPCLVDSLTGAVASQRVTEASKGSLNAVGNRVTSVKA